MERTSLLGNLGKARGLLQEIMGRISGKPSMIIQGKINVLIGHLQEAFGYSYNDAQEIICKQFGISKDILRNNSELSSIMN